MLSVRFRQRTRLIQLPTRLEARIETGLGLKGGGSGSPGTVRLHMEGPMRGAPARGGLPSALALLAVLLTCCVRCAGSARASNVVLVLVDDQDVQLGGMVSETTRKMRRQTT